jgi:hypothetical protein
MEIFYYAQIDGNSICYAVTQTAGEIIQNDMIRINSYDINLLGKKWENGTWVDPDV